MDEPLTPLTPIIEEKQALMTLPEALNKVIEGKRIARTSWLSADYCLMKDGWLSVFTCNKEKNETIPSFHTWLINDGDLLGTDWVVLPDVSVNA